MQGNYVVGEIGIIARECPAGAGLHIDEIYSFLRLYILKRESIYNLGRRIDRYNQFKEEDYSSFRIKGNIEEDREGK